MMTPTMAARPIPANTEPTIINTNSQGCKQMTVVGALGADGVLGVTPTGYEATGADTGVGLAWFVHCWYVQP
jgi:hypothetical protein